MPITPLPTAPSRKQSPSAFAENADAFLSQLPTFAAEATTLEQTVNAAEVVVLSAKNAAQAAQAAAEAVAYAAAWAVDEPYTVGQCVYGTDGQTYRAMAASTGVNPVGDATGKWVQISAGGLFNNAWGRGFVQSDSAAAARTSLELGTAATRDVGTDSGNVMEVGAFGIGNSGGGNRFTPQNATDWQNLPQGFRAFLTSAAVGKPPGLSYGYLTVIARRDMGGQCGLYVQEYDGVRAWVGEQHDGQLPVWAEFLHTGNILTTTGQSTTFPMTQKAVTDALNTKANTSALGTAATRDVGTDSGNVMQVGAFGLGKDANHLDEFLPTTPSGFYRFHSSSTNPPEGISLPAGGVISAVDGSPRIAGIFVSADGTLNVLVNNNGVVSRYNATHSGNILQTTGSSTDFPMTQKAVTDALNAKSELGVGQTWQNVSRTAGTTYTNSTGKTIQVGVRLGFVAGESKFYVDGLVLMSVPTVVTAEVWAVIPPGSTYKVSGDFSSWVELR